MRLELLSPLSLCGCRSSFIEPACNDYVLSFSQDFHNLGVERGCHLSVFVCLSQPQCLSHPQCLSLSPSVCVRACVCALTYLHHVHFVLVLFALFILFVLQFFLSFIMHDYHHHLSSYSDKVYNI